MAEIFVVKLPDGREIDVVSDVPPTAEEEAQIIAAEMRGSEAPKKPLPPKSRLTVSGSLKKAEEGFTLAGGRDEDFENLAKAKIGEKFIWDGNEAVKVGDTEFEIQPQYQQSSAGGTALRAALADSPGAAAGMAAFGAAAANPTVRSLPPIGRVGIPVVAGLVGGLGGSLASRKAIERFDPSLDAQMKADMAQHPTAAVVGANLSQVPFMRPGGGLRLLERSVGAGIGGGIQAGQELASDAPFDADAAARVFAATSGGAIFTDPTKLGNATMAAGGKASNAITSKLGNASTKSSVVQANAAANDIAMAPPEPPGQTTPPPVDQVGLKVLADQAAELPKIQSTELPNVGPQAVVDPATGRFRVEDNPLGYIDDSRKMEMPKVSRVRGIKGQPKQQEDFLPPETERPKRGELEVEELLGISDQVPQPAGATKLAELAQAGEQLPAVVSPEVQPNLLKTQKGALPEVAGPELKTPMEFETPARRPEVQAKEQADFNAKVLSVQRNLKNAGVDVDRATAVRLARLANNPEEFNAARQQLIDSVKKPAPEIPESGPMKSLAELPPKMGQDDAVMPEAEGVAPKAKEAAPAPTKPAAPKSDYERYQEIQKEWAAAVDRAKANPTPEARAEAVEMIRKLGAENEEIKNRHDGMPPEPPKAPEPAKVKPAKKAPEAPKRVSVDDLDAIDEIVGGQEAPSESYAVKTSKGTRNIIKKASDGNWYDEETGTMLSGGSRQVAIANAKKLASGKPPPSAMGITPPEDFAVRATRRGVEAANEKLTEMMAKADVEATNPQAQASMFDELFGPMKKSPVQQAEENEVNLPKPGEGRAQPKTEIERLREVQYEEGMLPTVDSITGRSLKSYRLKGEEPPAWMVENEKKNAEIIFNKLKKSAEEVGSEPAITPEVAGEIAQVPEQYRPFLTDLADRFKFMDKPILRNVSSGVSRFATFIKRQLGRQMDNIADVYSPLEGAILKRDHVEGLTLNNYSKRANLFELARKHMSNEDFFKMEKTLRNREPEATFALFKGNPKEQELIAAYNSTREVLDEVREKLVAAGRDIGDLADYFPSRVADYLELAKFHGRDAESKYIRALREFERTNKRKATTADKENLLNQILAGNRAGKGGPSWTKARTIDKVSEAELAFYEPPDVALAMYLREASKDIANSVFFGKIDVESPSAQPWADQSSFGRIVNEGLASGAIRDRGLAIIEDNMRDLFRTRSGIREDLSGIAAKLRRAQTALYLSDVSSAAVQYLDILSIAREYGVYGAAKAYGKNMPKVADIGVAEGHNIDLTELSRKKRGTGHVLTAPYRWALKNLLGAADEMQKSALMKGATAAISRAMKDPDSRLFKQTEERYSKMFPKEWEQMKKSLASDDFAKGKLDDSTKLFLFAEMARLQPISDSARAQGFNAATPWGKLLYALRSYWLTQLGIIRRQGYNELKKGTIEGFRKGSLAIMSYSLVVAMGQQAFQFAKDKVFGRDEANWDDYAIGGVLQLFGIPRYALFRASQTGWGSAGLEAALPGTSAVNDFGKDVATLAKFATGHRQADSSKSVETPLDLLQQLESVKYGPILGREVYALAGAGKLKAEREKERLNRGGEPRPSAREQILEFFVPPDAKRR